jgi:hypothetical protein
VAYRDESDAQLVGNDRSPGGRREHHRQEGRLVPDHHRSMPRMTIRSRQRGHPADWVRRPDRRLRGRFLAAWVLAGRCPAGNAAAGGWRSCVWWHLTGPALPRWRSQRRGRIATDPLPASGQVASWLARWQPSALAKVAGTMQDPQRPPRFAWSTRERGHGGLGRCRSARPVAGWPGGRWRRCLR